MNSQTYKSKYPIIFENFPKDTFGDKTIDDFENYFKNQIQEHPVAGFIGIFNHYEHTQKINGGIIGKEIKNAKNILFCFGKKLFEPKILSVRPRSIGICETETEFIISFLEAPNPVLNDVMIEWVNNIGKILI